MTMTKRKSVVRPAAPLAVLAWAPPAPVVLGRTTPPCETVATSKMCSMCMQGLSFGHSSSWSVSHPVVAFKVLFHPLAELGRRQLEQRSAVLRARFDAELMGLRLSSLYIVDKFLRGGR